jgi:hypothetical protein
MPTPKIVASSGFQMINNSSNETYKYNSNRLTSHINQIETIRDQGDERIDVENEQSSTRRSENVGYETPRLFQTRNYSHDGSKHDESKSKNNQLPTSVVVTLHLHQNVTHRGYSTNHLWRSHKETPISLPTLFAQEPARRD